MPIKLGAPPSFRDLSQTDTQRAAWEIFRLALWRELEARERHWSAIQWKVFQAFADEIFPVELKGVVMRAKRIHKEDKGLILRMITRDLVAEDCAAIHVALRIGALDLSAPLAYFASMSHRTDPSYLGDAAALRYVLSAGAHPDIKGKGGMVALQQMALREARPRGNPDAIRMLLAAGANPEIRNDEGETPLLLLCSFQEIPDSVVEGIQALRASGASMNATAADGQTPLGALREGRTDGQAESEESKKNRRELLGEFEKDDLDDLLPMGAPSRGTDIDGRRR